MLELEPACQARVAMSALGPHPRLFLNPADDQRFGQLLDGGDRVEQFQMALRSAYPRAIVRPRDLSAERDPVWYVYRDGHWVSPDAVTFDRARVGRVLASLEELGRRLLGEREAASVSALASSYERIARAHRTIGAGRERCRRGPLSG